MELLLIRSLWGVEESWEEAFPQFEQAGYVGIETAMPPVEQKQRFKDALAKHRFEYIPMVSTHGDTVDEHVKAYRQQAEAALEFEPRFLSCHTGRDFWSDADTIKFYEEVVKIEKDLGVKGAHETHRFRPFYNPWTTARVIEQVPELKLCCDYSHWVVVCERLLEDCDAQIAQSAKHCIHIHARVGHQEGPQVPDPRAPEWQPALEAHEKWWDVVWDAQEAAGMEVSTLTPEFGPPNYLWTMPHTREPVASLREVCDWQAQRQKANFEKRSKR
jgi:sugar phosphate isomerase/epimerase